MARDGGRDAHGIFRSVNRLLGSSTFTKLFAFEFGLFERIELLFTTLDCFLTGVTSEGAVVVLVLFLVEFGVLASSFFGTGVVDLSSNGNFRLGVWLYKNHIFRS